MKVAEEGPQANAVLVVASRQDVMRLLAELRHPRRLLIEGQATRG